MKAQVLDRIIQTARGRQAADLVLKNANILNVFTGELLTGDIAITDGITAGIGRYDTARQVEDLLGGYGRL